MIVYTAIYGGYDFLHEHPDMTGVQWRCYTDDPHLTSETWDVVYEPGRFKHSRTSAKWRKFHPPLDHERSLWVDGCVQVLNPDFVRNIEHICTEETPIALWRHPQRTRITDEAHVSAGMRKYRGQDMAGQILRYMERKPGADDLGLYASTVIGRLHTPAVLQFGAAWMAHNDLLTYQDQLSLPVLLDDYGLSVAIIPGSLIVSDGFAWRWGDHRSAD